MSDVESMRRYLDSCNVDHGAWTDERLETAISEAKAWIGGRRWSWHVVATNIVVDGKPSARGLRRG